MAVINASQVEVRQQRNAIFLQGVVQSKTSSTLTVKRTNNTVYHVDVYQSMIVNRFYNTLTMSEVHIGDTVFIGGVRVNNSTNIDAFLVNDRTSMLNGS